MRTLYLAMGDMLPVFQSIGSDIDIYFVSDKLAFLRNIKKIKSAEIYLESYLYDRAKDFELDDEVRNSTIKKYITGPELHTLFYMDRRLSYGPYNKFCTNDLASIDNRYFLELVATTLLFFENILIERKVSRIVGFTISNFSEYLCFFVARKINIQFLHVRHSKVLNFYVISQEINDEYNLLKSLVDECKTDQARINSGRKLFYELIKGSVYEGTVLPPRSDLNLLSHFSTLPLKLVKGFVNDLRYPASSRCRHSYGSFVLKNVLSWILPIRAKRDRNRGISIEEVQCEQLIFFPLNAEPEIAIGLWGRNYFNQIETVRLVAANLPVGSCLVVKEHPRNLGRRDDRFYTELATIPRVILVKYDSLIDKVVERSSCVVTLGGNIGFRAILLGTPVLTLGNTIYNSIGGDWVFRWEPRSQAFPVKWIQKQNRCLGPLFVFLSIVKDRGAPIDLYSSALKKKGRSGSSGMSSEKACAALGKLLENSDVL